MSAEEEQKVKSGKGKRGVRKTRAEYKRPRQKIVFKSWIESRRAARTKGPWKGVFRDPVKLYLRGVVMGYRRSRLNIHPNRSLIKIEDVKTKQDARYYLGHRVLYIYRAPTKKDPRTTKPVLRVISGKITGTHGNNGTVRVRFSPNLPSRAHGKRVRVLLWPHFAPN
mmetsp:Transcript_21725/g.34878  ORF Transcript_21725/g.34878 Transcript_21725/m.34878 type:complete len:167 (+) Transcript_21725:117-617(+)